MNIFYLDQEPAAAAQAHCDAHVVKMILETAQLLSTVWHKSGETPPELCYKQTHAKHPCVLWAEASRDNYQWLVELGFALCDEYTYRYGKQHKSAAVLVALSNPPTSIPDLGLTQPALAMPDEYKVDDAVASYRAYYGHKKATIHRFTFTTRPQPAWL